MHAPTPLRGSALTRFGLLVVGLLLCATGIVGLLESRLGLSPWDVLHQGLARHTPLTFGEANVAVGVVVLAGAWLLGARIGVGTVANSLLIGAFVQALTSSAWVTGLSTSSLPDRIGLLVGGVLITGFGSGVYLGATLGAGPRDSLMVVGAVRTGVRVGAVRVALEVAALAAGFALGGTVGIGTLAFALGIGPVVELSFWLLARSPLARPAGEARAQKLPRVADAIASAEQC